MKKVNFKKSIRRVKHFLQRLNYRHYICIGFTIACLLVSALCFTDSYIRFGESCRDFGLSMAYYFVSFGDGALPSVTVNNWSSVPLQLPFNLPSTWQEFTLAWNDYWHVWASWDNCTNYIAYLANGLYVLAQILLILLPFILVVVLICRLCADKTNNKYNVDTRCLRVWKRGSARIYAPVKAWCKQFVQFIKQHGFYWRLWLFVWLFNFNAAAILLEFFAYYFYFIISFDVVSLYRQVCKLLLDLSTAINTIPLIGWLLIAWLVWDKIRKSIGYRKLLHNEMKNRGLINELPIVSMIVGTMGKRKTTLLTDMGLSTEIMFRDKAFEKLLQNDLKFPYFPWIVFENAIKQAISVHYILI